MNKIQENELRQIIRNIIETELSEDLFPRESDSPYQKLFKKTLSKYGVSSPDELSPKLKEKFFNDIDSSWDAGENETDLDEAKFSKDKYHVDQKIKVKIYDNFDKKDKIYNAKITKINNDEIIYTYVNFAGQQWGSTKNKQHKDIVETTNSSSAGEYMTPKAFTKDGQDYEDSPASNAVKGWTKTKRIDEQIDFKDENFSPKQKMAQAIRSMRESLKGVEKLVEQSKLFKEQNNIKSNDMYKRSHAALRKISEQMIRIMNKMQEIK